LGATAELIGSGDYVVTLLGKSSIGRLGIFLNITADLGHVGCHSRWTLEITVVQPVRLYPGICIGQVAFWRPATPPRRRYRGRYLHDVQPQRNRDAALLAPSR
jgi:dCTP deaminase